MIAVIALLSCAGLALSFLVPGWSDLVLLAGPCLVASLWLWWRALGSPAKPAQPQQAQVVVDGSNVMHWEKGQPSVDAVRTVVRALEAKGLGVGVMFDANAGYKTHDRYQGDAAMARHLGLPADRVLVVPKGVPADAYILRAARGLGARIVTNDRYRDWQADFPEVADPGFLIRGGMTQGKPWFETSL